MARSSGTHRAHHFALTHLRPSFRDVPGFETCTKCNQRSGLTLIVSVFVVPGTDDIILLQSLLA